MNVVFTIASIMVVELVLYRFWYKYFYNVAGTIAPIMSLVELLLYCYWYSCFCNISTIAPLMLLAQLVLYRCWYNCAYNVVGTITLKMLVQLLLWYCWYNCFYNVVGTMLQWYWYNCSYNIIGTICCFYNVVGIVNARLIVPIYTCPISWNHSQYTYNYPCWNVNFLKSYPVVKPRLVISLDVTPCLV